MVQCITILPDAVASQIAAGESIERPASVVKELLENAIDAGARQLEVEVAGGGQRLLRVRDDGCGMSRDDALLAFERHATSKIRAADDLGRLLTLGFRGEALASIASVARVQLDTSEANGSGEGTRVVVQGGRLRDVRSIGHPPGTSVEVRDLFANVPGRRKFLKSVQTEQQQVHAVVTRVALAQSQLGVRLRSGGRVALDLAAAPDLAARLRSLYGAKLVASLLPIELRQGPIAVRGFVGRPQLHRARSSSQHYFVNRRWVRSRVLSSAVRDSYARFLDGDRQPVVFLFVEVEPAYVDVNVHPTKQEVRFHRDDLAADTVRQALHAALRGLGQERRRPGPRAPLGHWGAQPLQALRPLQQPATEEQEVAAAASPRPELAPVSPAAVLPLHRSATSEPRRAAAPSLGAGRARPAVVRAARQRQCAAALAERLPNDDLLSGPLRDAEPLLPGLRADLPSLASLEPLGQFADVFILAAGAEALYIIDQHVAHERILYETLQARLGEGNVEQQTLLFPHTLDLAPAPAAVAAAHAATLSRLGFDLEAFGGRSFLLRAVPALLASADGAAVLADVLDELAASEQAPSLAALVDDLLAMMACRAAVKANTRLNREEQRALLRRLDGVSTPHRCPHGRPVVLSIDVAAMKRWFQRT